MRRGSFSSHADEVRIRTNLNRGMRSLTGFGMKGKELEGENELFIRCIAVFLSIAAVLKNEKNER